MKRLLKILAGLVALVIVAALAIPMFISADYLKTQLQAQVKKATGRELEIKGAASLKLLPNIAIHVEDVTLGNPAGFSTPYLVHIDRLEAGAALKPLLAKELRITGITLDGAVLNLEQNKAGAKNWAFAAEKSAEPKGEAAEAEKKSSPLKQLAIGRVTVKNTTITYAKVGAKPIAVEKINFALDGADGAGALSLNGSVEYQAKPVQFKLGVAAMKALLAGQSSTVLLALNLPSGVVNFDGAVTLAADAPTAKGKFAFTSEDMAALLGWATGKKTAGNLPKKISVKTALGFAGMQSIALDDLNFSADSLAGSGNLALNLVGAVPAVNGALKLGEVNLDALTGKKSASDSSGVAKPASAKSGGWSDAPLDLSGLRAANAKLKISISKLLSGKLQVSDIAADMALNGGKMNLTLGNLTLYGGNAKGTVSLDGSGAAAGVGTNLTLAHIDMESLMMALSGASKLKGTASLSLNVNGRGSSQRALVHSLGGNGSLKMNDGAIKGINIASFLRDAKKGFVFGDSSTESTDFTELTASYTITQGVVSNKDLAMKSPVLRLSGAGTVSLPQRSINYRAVPSIVGTLKGQGGKDKLSSGGLDIPLIITGPWSAISVTPDMAGMLSNALKDPAALQQNLKDIGGSLKDFNSPKDIGKALLGGGKKDAADAPSQGGTAKPKATNLQEGLGGLLGGLEK